MKTYPSISRELSVNQGLCQQPTELSQDHLSKELFIKRIMNNSGFRSTVCAYILQTEPPMKIAAAIKPPQKISACHQRTVQITRSDMGALNFKGHGRLTQILPMDIVRLL